MSRVVGIDLGTTYSLVAYLDQKTGKPKCIPGPYGETLCRSVVSLDPDGSIIVGEPARRRLLTQSDRTIYSVKRLMGRGVADIQNELKLFPFRIDKSSKYVIRVMLGDRVFTPPEISAFILRELKNWAEAFFGDPVEGAASPVPASFNDAQRQATKDAGRIAGLEVLRLVNEPTAAALAYGLDKRHDGTVAVYDLGGGTFDISILKLHDGLFEVLATHRDTHLGGDDIDNRMIQIALEDIRSEWGEDISHLGDAVQTLRRAVIDAKERLSFVPFTDIVFEYKGKKYQRQITRELFEKLITDIVDRTLGPCRNCIKDAGVSVDQIDEVVMVGGSTRIPMVRK